jgi:hypothetical protein
MRISQLESLDESELSLLLYVVNVLEPIQSPKFVIDKPKQLLWVRHDALLWKLSRHQSKLTDEGKKIFNSLMIKLNKTPEQEHQDYERATNTTLTQSEFQF